MGEFSLSHWLIVLVILLLFFGPSKLPGLGASLGKAIRGFKEGLNEADPNQASKNPNRTEHISSTSGDNQTQNQSVNQKSNQT